MDDQLEPFRLEASIAGPEGTLALTGELDLHTSAEVDDAVSTMVSEGVTRLVVDMSGLAFVDSSGLRALLRARQALGDATDAVVLRAPSDAVRRLLDLTGLGELFERVE